MALTGAEIRKPNLESRNVGHRDTLVYSSPRLHFLLDAGGSASQSVELPQHLSHQTIGNAHMDLREITGHTNYGLAEQYVWDEVIGAKTKSGNPLFRITVAVALPTALVQGQSRPESPLRSAAPHRQPPSAVDHLSCLTANALHRSNPNEELVSRQGQTGRAETSGG
jgi:hypothetical protein